MFCRARALPQQTPDLALTCLELAGPSLALGALSFVCRWRINHIIY